MKTDTHSFLEALLFVADSPDHDSRPFQNSTIYDFHPEFIAAVDSFVDGFHAFLTAREIEIPSTRRSFGGNVFFSLSGHGVGFWDDSETEHIQPLLVEYSESLPIGYRRDPAHRFEELESSLSKRRGGKIDLAILAKFLPESRRKLFGMEEPTVAVFRTHTGKHHETYALFPEIPGDMNPAHCSCYAHIGQHGAAYAGAIPGTRPATLEEIAPLKRELESIGYSLDVRRRVTSAMDAKRRAALPR